MTIAPKSIFAGGVYLLASSHLLLSACSAEDAPQAAAGAGVLCDCDAVHVDPGCDCPVGDSPGAPADGDPAREADEIDGGAPDDPDASDVDPGAGGHPLRRTCPAAVAERSSPAAGVCLATTATMAARSTVEGRPWTRVTRPEAAAPSARAMRTVRRVPRAPS